MTTRQKLEEKGFKINLNTLIALMTLIGGSYAAVKIGGPLLSVPEKVADVDKQIATIADQTSSIERTQAVQTEALKTLADVAKDSRELRRDFDKANATTIAKDLEQDRELDQVHIRLNAIERK